MLRRSLVASLLALPLGACHGTGAPGDGGLDVFGSDGPSTDVSGPLALDFAVTGCATYDVGAALCTGTPPLTLSFSPVSSATLTRFQWTFGDGTPTSSDRSPTHTYAVPGSYDVSLVAGGPVGSVSRTRASFVQVTPLPTGAACDVDAQCAAGMRCLCGSSGPCGAAFPRGVCTAACPAAGCGAGAACAALDVPPHSDEGPDAASDAEDAGAVPDATTWADDSTAPDAGTDAPATSDDVDVDAPVATDGPPPIDAPTTSDASIATDAAAVFDASAAADTPAVFDATAAEVMDASAVDAPVATFTRAPVCLASCQTDADCTFGLVCRALPVGDAAAGWGLRCVPAFFRDVAATCRDATGALDDDACATGTCADLGALGLCSATCASGAACPPGNACATFANGSALCVRPCSTSFTCVADPLLACAAAGGAGALGFQIAPAPATGTNYCAPRACATQADCAPAGTCAPLGAGGHCTLP